MSLPLTGRGILVTRPIEHAEALATGIRAAGGEAILFPAIQIVPVFDTALSRCLTRAAKADAAIFISPNAARCGLAALDAQAVSLANVRIYALGAGTARELMQRGVTNVIQPDGQDSEALLALPSLQDVAQQRMVIFRGVGGRALLADTLRARGAQVEYAECYRRVRPAHDAAPLLQRWSDGQIDAVTITSAESLHNLVCMLGEAGAALLRATPVFVPHEKIAQSARAAGIAQVCTTAAGDTGLLDGLMTWFQTHA